MHLDIREIPEEEVDLYRVFLNNHVIEDCFAANEEEGWVEVFDKDRFKTAFDYMSSVDPLLYRIRKFGKIKIIKDKNSMLRNRTIKGGD